MGQEMLGHANVATTQKYLGVNYASARQAVEEMAFSVDIHRTHLWGNSLKNQADENLFRELARRGYNLSSLSENDTQQGEIVKIS